MIKQTKMIETIKIRVKVTADDIENGKCGLPSQCMEKVAIERALRSKKGEENTNHYVKIDGGQVTLNLDGFKWRGHTPKLAKRSLIRFDSELTRREKAIKAQERWVSKVEPHEYILEVTKIRAVNPVTKSDRKRLDQINAARARRAEKGEPDHRKYRLKYRVAGMHPNV